MIEILLLSGYTEEEAKYYMSNHLGHANGDYFEELLLDSDGGMDE